MFVGESRGHEGAREVTGFHNWIQFYLQEKAGHIDYKGWVPPRGVRVSLTVVTRVPCGCRVTFLDPVYRLGWSY